MMSEKKVDHRNYLPNIEDRMHMKQGNTTAHPTYELLQKKS